jgi:hypothetical protein
LLCNSSERDSERWKIVFLPFGGLRFGCKIVAKTPLLAGKSYDGLLHIVKLGVPLYFLLLRTHSLVDIIIIVVAVFIGVFL